MLTSYELEDLKFLIFGLRVIAPVIVSVKWPTVVPTNPNQAWFQFLLRLFVSWTGPQICPDHHQYIHDLCRGSTDAWFSWFLHKNADMERKELEWVSYLCRSVGPEP